MNRFFHLMRSAKGLAILMAMFFSGCLSEGRGSELPAVVGSGYITRNWQIQDGLPDNSVNAIIQSRDGFLWMGTNNGVARFDGVSFLHFGSAGSERIRALFLAEDAQGNIWVGTRGQGLRVIRDGTVKQIQAWPAMYADIRGLQITPDGRIVVHVEGGDAVEVSLKFISGQDVSGADLKVRKIDGLKNLMGGLSQRDGVIYGKSRQGVFSLVGQERRWIYPSEGVDAFTLSRDGGMWVVGRDSLKKVDATGNVEHSVGLPSQWPFLNHPWDLILEEIDQGHIFMGGYLGGVFKAGLDGELKQPFRESGLFQSTITSILTDRQGTVWVGTSDCGLYRIKRQLVSTVMLPEDAISRIQTVANHGADGFWIGTSGDGMFLYSGGELKRCQGGADIANLDVRSILEDSTGNVWIGTENGLFRLLNDGVEEVRDKGSGPKGISAILQDPEGVIWAAGVGGIGRVVQEEGRLSYDVLKGSAGIADLRAIVEDGKGGFWVGGLGTGLLHVSGGRWVREAPRDGLGSCTNVVSLLRDREGTLWIGDYEAGLHWIRDGKAGHVTTADGLVSDSIAHLTEDGLGRLWIGTTNGLMAIRKSELLTYDPKKAVPLGITVFNTEEGMSSPLCSGGGMPAFAWDQNDRLFFSNMKGLGIVDASNAASSGLQGVAVDRYKQDGRDMVFSGSSIAVPSSCKRLDVLLTALDLAAPDRVRLKCRLSGYEEAWYDMGFNRTVSYQNLPIGEYELSAFAVGRDGSVARLAQPVKISVVPRFWERMWFKGVVGGTLILGICAIGWFFLGRRSKREISRLRFQNLISQERARIARDIHDEIGAGLAQIGILADLGSETADMPPEGRKNLGMIGKRARSIVGSLDGIVWAINPSNDTLESLISYIVRMGDEVFEGCGVRYSSHVPDGMEECFVRSEVRYNLAMVVKEAFANALKHSRCTEVRLEIFWEKPLLRVVVSDNGTGFDVAEAGAMGNGLGNQRSRMSGAGGEVSVVSTEVGTRVELVVSFKTHDGRK